MSVHPIRFGIQTGQQGFEWSELLDLWQKADAWGYDSLWVFDHLYPVYVHPEGPCLEGWTTLSALALATKRARVGSLVTSNTFRHPSLTAKMAASVDHISGGRLNLGIGAGWYKREHRSLGFGFASIVERLEALDEACDIVKQMFANDRTTFRGKHYSVSNAMCLPRPVQPSGPPILIGGAGKKHLLRIVAKHADMWNASGSPERMGELIECLRAHGDSLQRDVEAIEKTVIMPFAYGADEEREGFLCGLVASMDQSTPDQAHQRMMVGGKQRCLDLIERYLRVGVTHFIFMLIVPYFEDEVRAFAEEVIAEIRPALPQ